MNVGLTFINGGYVMKFAILIAGAAAALCSTTVRAQVTDGYSRAQFQAAVAGSSSLTLQNFDSFTAGNTLTSDGFVTYGSSVGTPLITNSFLTSTSPNGLGRTGVGFFLSTDQASFTFSSAVTAFAIDINTFATANGSYRVVLSNGGIGNSIFETFPGAGTGQFIGLTSVTPFTSVTLSAITGSSFTLDTLIYGSRAAISGVPEPATWAMMILGFGAIGASLRIRRARAAIA